MAEDLVNLPAIALFDENHCQTQEAVAFFVGRVEEMAEYFDHFHESKTRGILDVTISIPDFAQREQFSFELELSIGQVLELFSEYVEACQESYRVDQYEYEADLPYNLRKQIYYERRATA